MKTGLVVAACACVALAWGGAAWMAMSPSGAAPSFGSEEGDGTGKRAVRSELGELRRDVLGKTEAVRGDKVIGNVVKARDDAFEYSPREVCLKMKLDNPEAHADLDCSRKEYDSPHDWNDR